MCYNSTASNSGWLSVLSRLSSLYMYLLQHKVSASSLSATSSWRVWLATQH